VFGSFDGLPIHALVVHAAVILVPLAATLGILFLRPAWRMTLRWPLVAAAAVATATAYVARQSGEVLKESLGDQLEDNAAGRLVDRHQELADRLWLWLLVFLAVTVVVALALPRLTNPLAGGAAAIIVAALAVVVIVLVAYTGHQGSKAVWNPEGTVDYSGG
jgi:glucan phosphoethanolaminetransferase (alkaline phosphatase superfamily)